MTDQEAQISIDLFNELLERIKASRLLGDDKSRLIRAIEAAMNDVELFRPTLGGALELTITGVESLAAFCGGRRVATWRRVGSWWRSNAAPDIFETSLGNGAPGNVYFVDAGFGFVARPASEFPPDTPSVARMGHPTLESAASAALEVTQPR